ncbi:MAG TPA: GNAT family protein [Kofleriaceae bacterium]|nr:GNAT family protein [Kofleriaceae bacterium]
MLDAFTLADVDVHVAGEDDEMARRFGWWPKRSTSETVRAAIERWTDEWKHGGTTRVFAVRDATTLDLVGHCELRLKPERIAHASYSTLHQARRRGFASRALVLVTAWGIRELDLARIELYIEPDNIASRAVALRAGFREHETLRSHLPMGDEFRDAILYVKLA